MRLLWVLFGLCSMLTHAQSEQPQRIVTLAPHLAEWVYSLKMGDALVGVSAHSDYPAGVETIQQVADYNGADIAAIIALDPTLVLVWQGGNKPQDIARLKQAGLSVYSSHPKTPQDIARELREVGELLDRGARSEHLARDFELSLTRIRHQYTNAPARTAFYYLWDKPLMTIGPSAWPNQILHLCGVKTLFADSPVDYPQVSVQQVLLRQPELLIAASERSARSLATFWEPHRSVLSAPLIVVNPDILSRFTLRLIPAVKQLCRDIQSTAG